MKLEKTGVAGTLESGDLYIEIEPGDGSVCIELNSTVQALYGRHIKQLIADKLQEFGITDALVHATDKGALDCTICARLSTAVQRAGGQDAFAWTR